MAAAGQNPHGLSGRVRLGGGPRSQIRCPSGPYGNGDTMINVRKTIRGGSDAVEVALKIARAATGRFKTLSFWDAFHGAGVGAHQPAHAALDAGGLRFHLVEHVAAAAAAGSPTFFDPRSLSGMSAVPWSIRTPGRPRFQNP